MKKRLFSIFCTLCIAAAFAVTAQALNEESVSEASTEGAEEEGTLLAGDIVASGECGDKGDNVTWTLDSEGTLTISGAGKMKDYASLCNHSEIKSILIESGVTSVGSSAFRNCNFLSSVTIPESVVSIGDSAFRECKKLESVTIPNGVISIGIYTFSDCSELASVIIPNSVIVILLKNKNQERLPKRLQKNHIRAYGF